MRGNGPFGAKFAPDERHGITRVAENRDAKATIQTHIKEQRTNTSQSVFSPLKQLPISCVLASVGSARGTPSRRKGFLETTMSFFYVPPVTQEHLMHWFAFYFYVVFHKNVQC